MSGRPRPAPIVGVSAAIQRARELVQRYAPTTLPVLLCGPTGAGKELLAQHVHWVSGRSGEMVDVNCGALPRDLVESLLFGHRRGAFTGAVDSVPGYVERASRGTLFLDELLHLPGESQVKLLRVLETGEVERLGDGLKRRVDVRVVAAVQDDLNERLRSGAFRRDLYQRVAGVVVRLPPLVERLEDLLPLALHFAGVHGRVLEPDCLHLLTNYSWPGNVRELRLAVERAGQLVENGTVPPSALAEAIQLGHPGAHGEEVLDLVPAASLEREQLCVQIRAHAGNAAQIARTLGIGRSTLFRRMKVLGLSLRWPYRVSTR